MMVSLFSLDVECIQVVLDIGTHGMNAPPVVNHWNPHDILDVGNVSFRFGLLVLNQPINIERELMFSLWNRASLRVTVDGGTNRWFRFLQGGNCVAPELITGDMDSIKQNVLTHFKREGSQIIPTPNQNETDFTKALRHVHGHIISKNLQLDGIIAVCETSGRLDQILANLNTLYKAKDIVGNVPVYQLAKNSLSWLLAAGSHQINVGDATVKKGCWCSLVALGAGVERVTTTGLKWNLDDRVMEFGGTISTSNTYSGDPVVTVKTSGSLVWSMGLCDDDT
ncbi:thiamin pyrophosphokinase 1 isoform X3 [Zootermopsis nevadensis]|uniref:thiamin pyrophosphokinase 1 isoform X3 n=1 Tax=Zootermopsis nevadensis TaxID=136037 RepID=UPI000B8EE2FC|nr:thiamin pyrophosphokinase 1 isoform X3 [Zootermopsis nevadensis]